MDNQRVAFNRLARLIIAHLTAEVPKEISDRRVRTYHKERNEVKDHGTGETLSYKDAVDKCLIGDMIESRARYLAQLGQD